MTDRVPPHDLAAEQVVLGAMMLNPGAVAVAVERLRPEDFYRNAHGVIFASIVGAWADREPTDEIAIATRLQVSGDLARIGGALGLHALVEAVPVAVSVGHYAKTVAERANVRRIIEAGTRIAQMAYESNGEIGELPAHATKLIADAVDDRQQAGLTHVSEMVNDSLDAIEEARNGGRGAGILTGIHALDDATGGFRPGQMIIVAGRPGMGKALAIDTPLPTPDGWTTMGAVQVGDMLIGADGLPTMVVAATDVMTGRPCYEVEFSDGSVIVADAQHQWLTETRADRVSPHRAAAIRTTEQIAATLRCNTADQRLNHKVPLAAPFKLPDTELPIDPYTLGVWLGDGHSYGGQITSADPEIPAAIAAAGYVVTKGVGRYSYNVRQLKIQLNKAGLLQNKHIPAAYLRASEEQRRALLAGLLDTDGSVANEGAGVRFEITHQQLAMDTQELILSLGYRCTYTTRSVPGRRPESSTCYRLTFTPDQPVFRLPRKADRMNLAKVRSADGRYIRDVRSIASVPVRCVQVDNADHLYLAGRTCIPTHNSVMGIESARDVAISQRKQVAIFTLEMSRNEVLHRLYSAMTSIEISRIVRGQLSDADWTKISRAAAQVADAPILIDDSAPLTLPIIAARARRAHARSPLALVVIDYLQLIKTGRRAENRQQEVTEISQGVKLLAKELGCPVLIAAQLNRNNEGRTDKRPQLSDLRESGSLEQDADLVILLHRDNYYDPDTPRGNEIDVILAKQRSGQTGAVVAGAQFEYVRFINLPQL